MAVVSAPDKKTLEQQRLRILVSMGEEAHSLCRKGVQTAPSLAALSHQLMELDTQLAKAIGMGNFSTQFTVCPGCGKAIEPGSMFCAECGFSIKDLVASFTGKCSVCQALTSDGQHFCSVCGSKL